MTGETGAISSKTVEHAFAVQSALAAETVPTEYSIGSGSDLMDHNRPFDNEHGQAGRDIIVSVPKAERPSLPFNTWAIFEKNGLGTMLNAAYGLDTISTLGTSGAYQHDFTLADTIVVLTKWEKTQIYEVKTRLCALKNLVVDTPNDKATMITANFDGGLTADSSDFGSASYIDQDDQDKIVRAKMWALTLGAEGEELRSLLNKFKLDIGLAPKLYVPAGADDPRQAVGGKRTFKLTLDIAPLVNDDELMRYRDGLNTTPAATSHQTCPGLLTGVVLTATGPHIGYSYGSAVADEGNSGSLTVGVTGTHSGSSADDLTLEIVAGDPTSPNTFRYRWGTGDWSEATAITGTAQEVGNGISVTFSGTSGGATGDLWTVAVTDRTYLLSFTFPYCRLEKFQPRDGGEALEGTLTLTPIVEVGDTTTYPSAQLVNTISTAY